MPMAAPAMADSDKGVSMILSLPNRSSSPSVMRKTPPSFPTSSPRRMTRSSRAISRARALFSACTIVMTAMSELLPLPCLPAADAGGGVSEEVVRRWWWDCLHGLHGLVDCGCGLLQHAPADRLVPEAGAG